MQMASGRLWKTCSITAALMLSAASLFAGEPAQPEPPARPLLYFFEHVSLRQAAFRYDEDIQRLIANPGQAGEPVARLFAKAALYAAKVPTFKSETALDDMTGFMRQISFETIRRGSYTLHLMGMPPPEHPTEAYYIAIVYKDGEPLVAGTPAPSTRYIALEKTQVEGRAFALTEWDASGKHKTHGFGNQEPTVRDLVGATFQLLEISGTQ
jgi:hypothetical protein